MTSHTANQTSESLEAISGPGRDRTSQAGQSATVWKTPAYHIPGFDDAASDVELQRVWEARKGRQANPNWGARTCTPELAIRRTFELAT